MSQITDLKSKIFLDSGNPEDTQKALEILGFLDGQTTNPTLVAKNPVVKKKLEDGYKFSSDEIFDFYRGVVTEISNLIPKGSVSIEVYADDETTVDQMYVQAKEMNSWISNAHIKFPTTKVGLEAAKKFVDNDQGRVNMTLGFTQEQAAAVYAATTNAQKGDIFYSSFIGRLFDNQIDGVVQLRNCMKMLENSDQHLEVLACSFRNINQFLACIASDVDIVTASLGIIEDWKNVDFKVPGVDFQYTEDSSLNTPEFESIDLQKPWTEFDISSEFTKVGVEKFAKDWNNLVK